jgi:putative DNA primase/helicase
MSDNENDKSKQYLLQNHLITVTIFGNYAAKTMETWDMTLPEIGQMVLGENRKRKNMLPWMKMAEFGDLRTPKGSLRNDANVKWFTGVEIDHDNGRPIAEAIAQLRAAGIRALVYTSPSHLLPDENGVAVEKWRVMAPTSGPLDPSLRAGLAARLNGVLKGAASAESFVLSQSYYFGSVDRNPAHMMHIVDGDFIDLADDLDADAIGSPGPATRARKPKADKATPSYADADIDRMLALCTAQMHTPEMGWRTNMLAVTASLVSKMWTDEAIRQKCGPSCIDGEYDDDLTVMIDGARAKWGIPDPREDAEFAELLGSVREDAKAAGMDVPSEEPTAQRKVRKPVVQVRAGALDTVVDEAARHLLAAGVEFYQRGGVLVRPVILQLKSFDGEPTFSAQLVAVNVHYMRDVMSRMIDWERFDKKANQWLPCNPPAEVAMLLLNRFGDWPFRVLAGIITTQTMRPDGTILSEPGYDAATQLLLINPPPMAAIAEQPSRADAEAALALLLDLLSEFPFTLDDDEAGGSTSRAVALSAIISVICRGAFPVVPMHAIDAPAAGTGKSYLLSAVSWIATGQPMAVMSAGKTAEETEKRLGAAVIAGQTMITIDNVEGKFGNDSLCQLIEQVRPKVRILGQSTLVEVDGRAMCIFCNGNNLTLVGDIYRRVLTCRLDAKVDRPEKRQFTKDPRAMILADRGKYIAACLTICRAYQVAKQRPQRRPQIGSFNEWSNTVRSALVWLGEADCVDTMDATVGEDPTVIAHQALMEQWHNVFGTRAVLLRDVVAKCNEVVAGMGSDTLSGRYVYYELRSAVQATDPEVHRRDVDVSAFGYKMRHYRDRWIDGMCFAKRISGGDMLWFVRTGAKTSVFGKQRFKDKTETKSTS